MNQVKLYKREENGVYYADARIENLGRFSTRQSTLSGAKAVLIS